MAAVMSKLILATLGSPQAVQPRAGRGHPFPAPYVRARRLMLFNIGAYSRLLLADFERRGGRIVTAELSGRKTSPA